jgi:hypothetical protein
LALFVAGGCESTRLPAGPSVEVTATPTSPPVAATIVSLASLAIEDAYAIGGQGQDSYVYEVRFRLREQGGRIGATVKEIAVSNPHLRPGERTSKAIGSESCWGTELRVPPGGMLDTFYTDAGAEWLGYCWVGIDALPGVSSLGLEVFFKDDAGVQGSVTAPITVFR